MYRLIIQLCLGAILFAGCSKEEVPNPDNVVGTWRLIEQIVNPQSGSGLFELVISEKIITFNADGTYYSNGSVCYPSVTPTGSYYGSYSIQTNLLTTLCSASGVVPTVFFVDQGRLYITYPNDEGSLERFERI